MNKSALYVETGNYRPISILHVLSKLLEKRIHDLLSHYLCLHSPLSQHQWGFTSGKLTTSAHTSFTHARKHLTVGIRYIRLVFFDLSKAFDTVPHQQLLYKLSQLHVNPFFNNKVDQELFNQQNPVSRYKHRLLYSPPYISMA